MFVPPVCPSCGRRIEDRSDVMCRHCMVSLPRCTAGYCRSRLLPLLDAAPCPPGIVASWSPYSHDSLAGALIRSVKYYGRPKAGVELGRIFGCELASTADFNSSWGLSPDDIELLLPVPLHWTKLIGRGFNQSRCIAMGLAEALRADVAENLKAVKPHRTQTHRTAAERVSNVRGSFMLVNPQDLQGRHVAIVDDVITTGATVTECIIALGKATARPASLSVLSLGLAGVS